MKTTFTLSSSETDKLLHPDKNDVTTLLAAKLTPAEQIEYLTKANFLLQQELITTKQQLEDMREHHQKMREDERKRISRDLHDELGQYLVALKIDLDIATRAQQHATGSGLLQPELQNMYRTLDACVASVSNVVATIRTPKLQAENLLGEIEELFVPLQKQGVAVNKLIGVETFCLSTCTTTEVYHLLQEAITNITRHAQASQVSFTVYFTAEKGYHFQLADNGIGIQYAKSATGSHFGITGMQERAARMSASLRVSQGFPSGTRIDLFVPSDSIA